jgi:hypothetical protein
MVGNCHDTVRESSQSRLLRVDARPGPGHQFSERCCIVQENRTPDNLFYVLCSTPRGAKERCSTTPNASQYNNQTSNWLDKNSSTGVTQPGPVALANKYDLSHTHKAFTQMCDVNSNGVRKMDGAGDIAPRNSWQYSLLAGTSAN